MPCIFNNTSSASIEVMLLGCNALLVLYVVDIRVYALWRGQITLGRSAYFGRPRIAQFSRLYIGSTNVIHLLQDHHMCGVCQMQIAF
jgi:hypothetical protein